MRPAAKCVLVLTLLLALSALAFSFNVSSYLYEGENASSVASSVLPSNNGVAYTLYTISGIPSLLTADGVPFTDESAIQGVLSSYYNSALMPSSDEMAALRAKLLSFNDSRNYKTRYGQAEATCRQSTGLVTNPCNDTESCYVTANVVCGLYAAEGGGGGCYPEILEPMLLDYQTHVNAFDKYTTLVLSDLSGITSDNAAGRISEMQSAIATLKTESAAQTQSKLRFPEGNDSCPDCVAICPALHLDTASLDDLSSSLDTLSGRLAPVYALPTTAKQIAASTTDRLAYQQASSLAAIWVPKWKAFKTQYAGLRSNATSVSLYLKDASFTAAFTSFQNAWNSMETRISNRNYTGVENDLSAAQKAVPTLQTFVTIGAKPYLDALAAQNHAGDELKQARWSVRLTDAAAVKTYNALVLRKNSVDASFAPPMSASAYQVLTRNYSAVINDTDRFLSSQGKTTDAAGNFGVTFGQSAVNGVFTLTDALVALPPSTRNTLSPIIPPVVLGMADLAVASIALLVFIGGLYHLRGFLTGRIALGAWVLALFLFLFLVGMVSVGLFVIINNSASSSNLGDWLALLSSTNSSYVAIDSTGAPVDALAAMRNCSANITAQLAARYNNTKNVSVFSFSNTSCTWAGQSNWTYDQCLAKTGGAPIMFLHYNATSSTPRFSVVFQKQADAYYNTADYYKCEIGDVLN